MGTVSHRISKRPWNKGKLTGQKPPLKLKEIWAIRIRLQISKQVRDLALFNLALDSKLRSCDLVKIRVRDVTHGATVAVTGDILLETNAWIYPVSQRTNGASVLFTANNVTVQEPQAGFIADGAGYEPGGPGDAVVEPQSRGLRLR